jgi:hypothetical protein
MQSLISRIMNKLIYVNVAIFFYYLLIMKLLRIDTGSI